MAVLPVSGDYQIAHLPPTAASVGAARWAAQFFNIGRTRYFRAGRGSGSDMRTASDSLYDDLQQFGTSRGTRSRFSNAVRRAGSLETCGFKQRFWSLLGLRPKVTRARERGILFAGDMKGTSNGPSGTPAPTGCATGDMTRYVWAGCAHRGRSNAGRESGWRFPAGCDR